MGGGGSKPAPAPAKQEPALTAAEAAYLEVKRARDRLAVAERRLQHELNAYNAKAKEAAAAGNKDAAMRFVRLRMLKEKRRKDTFAQLGNLDRVVSSIEAQQATMEMARAIQAGTAAIQKLQEELPLEEAQRIMEDTEEALDYARELDELCSRELGQDAGIAAETERVLASLMASEGLPAAPAPATPAALAVGRVAPSARAVVAGGAAVSVAEGSGAAAAGPAGAAPAAGLSEADAALLAELAEPPTHAPVAAAAMPEPPLAAPVIAASAVEEAAPARVALPG